MERQNDWADRAEQDVLDQALILAPSLGWTRRMTFAAAKATSLSQGEAELLLPHGPRDLAALLARRHDQRALASLENVDPMALKVRQRIRRAVAARLHAAAADEAGLRRWAGFLVLPTNLPLALRLLWDSADSLWRWAGNTATDENHYTKRAILSEILASSLALRLSDGEAAALAHLDGRIDAVMAFEKWKAGLRVTDAAVGVARALGRLRYGML